MLGNPKLAILKSLVTRIAHPIAPVLQSLSGDFQDVNLNYLVSLGQMTLGMPQQELSALFEGPQSMSNFSGGPGSFHGGSQSLHGHNSNVNNHGPQPLLSLKTAPPPKFHPSHQLLNQNNNRKNSGQFGDFNNQRQQTNIGAFNTNYSRGMSGGKGILGEPPQEIINKLNMPHTFVHNLTNNIRGHPVQNERTSQVGNLSEAQLGKGGYSVLSGNISNTGDSSARKRHDSAGSGMGQGDGLLGVPQRKAMWQGGDNFATNMSSCQPTSSFTGTDMQAGSRQYSTGGGQSNNNQYSQGYNFDQHYQVVILEEYIIEINNCKLLSFN